MQVGKEATYSRGIYLSFTASRDLFADRLEKGFDGQQVQARLDRASLCFGTHEVTQAFTQYLVPTADPQHGTTTFRALPDVLREPLSPEPGQVGERIFGARQDDQVRLGRKLSRAGGNAQTHHGFSSQRIKFIVVA